MNLKESISTCFNKYSDFSGVASRSEYWYFTLFYIAGLVVTKLVSPYLYFVYVFGMLAPVIAVSTRRLHDTNRSGWLQLLVLIPIIGSIVLVVMYVEQTREDSTYR